MCTTNNRSKQITATVTAVDGGVIMKKFFRHFLFLILCLSCYTASAGTDDNVGYIVGNSYGVGPSDQKWRETGPNGDATVIFRYATILLFPVTATPPVTAKLEFPFTITPT